MLQQAQGVMAGLADQGKAVLGMTALELQELEARVGMAQAEAEVAAAEVAVLEAELADKGLSEPRRKLLELQIAAQQRRKEALEALAEQAQAFYTVRQELAGKSMALDPSDMLGMLGMGQPLPPDGSASGKADDPRFDEPPPGSTRG